MVVGDDGDFGFGDDLGQGEGEGDILGKREQVFGDEQVEIKLLDEAKDMLAEILTFCVDPVCIIGCTHYFSEETMIPGTDFLVAEMGLRNDH